MFARILDRSRQVLELFRELRRPAAVRVPVVPHAVVPHAVARGPEPLHAIDVRLAG